MIARRFLPASVTAFVLALAGPAFVAPVEAAPKTPKPKNATALCEDGTYSKARTQQGACSSHGGVKTWYGIPELKPASGVARKATQRPKNATAECEDGTYSKAATQQGACSSHGGVKTWFGEPARPAMKPPSTPPAKPTASSDKAPTVRVAARGNPTAKCKDGTFSYAKVHTGACSYHGGVAEWYK